MKINLMAPINQLGYGIVGLNVLKALSETGNEVSLFYIGPMEAPPEHHPLIKRCIENTLSFDPLAPTVRLYHQFDMGPSVGRGKRVGFPIFELDRLTPNEIHGIKTLDHVLVCSKWAKQIVEKDTGVGASVVPLGVDTSIFYPSKRNNDGITRFFTAGKLEYRKGHDVIIEAFNLAFEPTDDVELVMCCDNPFLTPEETESWIQTAKLSPMGDKIKFVPRKGSQQELADLMRQCHCGVFPARAEGWNLELLEMMACGGFTIATNYSAHTEYVDNTNAFLVDVEKTERAFDGTRFFTGQGEWAYLGPKETKAVSRYMQNFYEHSATYRSITSLGGINTAKKFSWENTAKRIVDVLQTL